MTNNVINSKRFVVRQSLVGKNATINVEFNNGVLGEVQIVHSE